MSDASTDLQPMDWDSLKVFGDVVRHNARVFGDRPAFIGERATIGFAAIGSRMNQLCRALDRLGLVAGDRVAFVSRNRPEVLELYGVAKSGLVAVPLNWRLPAAELAHPLADSRPRVVIAEPQYLAAIDSLRGALSDVGEFVVLGEARDGWTAYESLLAGESVDEPDRSPHPDDPLALMYSSGTTGVPKGAVITHRGALANARVLIEHTLQLNPSDVGLSAMPLFHVGGMWYHLFPSYARGCTTVLLSEFEPRTVLAALEKHRVTQVHLVPTMIAMLLEQPEMASTDLARLRTMYYAASPIPPEVLERAMRALPRCGFVQSFGSTEAGSITCLSPADHLTGLADPGRKHLLHSCGRAVAGARIEIRDVAGRSLAPGSIGEITVQSPRTMAGYWANPQATASTIVDGWLYTGDVGFMDSEGYVTLIDRKHDMIVTGGENVYPKEVEEVLRADPDVAEVAVFAVPHSKWVEQVAAAVVLKPGCRADAEALRSRAPLRGAADKCPKPLILVASRPKPAPGKVLRKDLRARYAGPT